MDASQFRQCGYEMIDYVADLIDQLRDDRDPLPQIEPGYIREILPSKAPEKPQSWKAIMADIEPVVLHGMTFWQHPFFFAYFPSGNCWPSILGSILSNAFGGRLATWEACPAMAELETILLDWCAKMFGLPPCFYSKLSNPMSEGGGCIQSSASECILVSLLIAREKALLKLRQAKESTASRKRTLIPHVGAANRETDNLRVFHQIYQVDAHLKNHLVAYGSSESHSSFEKACMIADVRCRLLKPDESGAVSSITLLKAIKEDTHKGLVPFYYNAILGSTSTCAFDSPAAMGPICDQHGIWLHCDCAYAGGSFSCPEMRFLMDGIEHASSINVNANKWMMVNFDCSLHWVKDRASLMSVMGNLEPKQKDAIIPDYRFWGIPTTRRFRGIKLWFTLRMYGVKGLRKMIRRHVYLAKTFENFVKADSRFEVVGNTMGEAWEKINVKLLETLNASKSIHMVPSSYLGRYCIRFAIASEQTTEEDIIGAWERILDHAEFLIASNRKLSGKKTVGDRLSVAKASFKRSFHKGKSTMRGGSAEMDLERFLTQIDAPADFMTMETSTVGGNALAEAADIEYEQDLNKKGFCRGRKCLTCRLL